MIELTLPAMTCAHCVKTVTQTVQRLDPAAVLQFDLPMHRVTIESTQPPQALRDALGVQGYTSA